MNVYLIRHGRTALQARGGYQGWIDEPLSEEGKAALMSMDMTGGLVYVTPLRRTAQTAARLFPCARQIMVEDLKEMNFGDFEGRSAEEMKDDPAYRAWVDGQCEGQCPGGESKAEFAERTCNAFAKLVDAALAQGDKDLFIVAHGGTQMVVMERFVDSAPPFYSWLTDCGQGYQLDTAPWKEHRRLTIVGTVDYSGGSSTTL